MLIEILEKVAFYGIQLVILWRVIALENSFEDEDEDEE